ncbi:hypothetical protein L596_010516 [Steinernema carpocapsae]|uniref:Transcription and mRNA export factor ENY2 n=1 Tax=Steinernema carpocapsae TaxID=34508 RepID=A0A4U5PIV7_STECR|nr:hypothetical protein L596_010516 [Steinernema carpocapsae]
MNTHDFFYQRCAEFLFDESRERQHIQALIEQRLTECGWAAAAELKIREYFRTRGKEKVDIAEIVADVKKNTPIPENVKEEIIDRISEFVRRKLMDLDRSMCHN